MKQGRRHLVGQAGRYLIATVLSACVSLILPALLHEFIGIREEIAVAGALITVFIMNFFMIRIFVFRSRSDIKLEFRRFFTVSIGFRIAEYLLFLAIFRILGLNYILSLAISLVISFITKFIVHRKFVFNRQTF